MDISKYKTPLDKNESDCDAEDCIHPAVFDYELIQFSDELRTGFTLAVIILCSIAITGNIASLVVNYRRKMRPFFRACLVSLAVNDLLTSIFSSATYLTQFSSDYIQIWYLGEVMCNFIPFIVTAAILCSSMTLVCIASDRYYAVMPSTSQSKWQFNRITSVTGMVLIGGLAICVSTPMIAFYNTFTINVIITDPMNLTHYLDVLPLQMCASNMAENTYYYVVVLSLIFIPTLVAFVWLNTILASKIWNRRRTMKNRNRSKQLIQSPESLALAELNRTDGNKSPIWRPISIPSENLHLSSTLDSPIISPNQTPQPARPWTRPHQSTASKSRETRHIRMFCVVIVLMALFIFFRLPAWIFLITRMYGKYVTFLHWILHFSFGILTLTSCVLNPFLYTFLLETIEQISNCLKTVNGCCGLGFCFRFSCLKCQLCNRIKRKNYQETCIEITPHKRSVHISDESDEEHEDIIPNKNGKLQMVYTIQPGII